MRIQPRWFVTAPGQGPIDHRPMLFALPGGALWLTPEGDLVMDTDGVLWIPLAGQIAAAPSGGVRQLSVQEGVVADTEHGLFTTVDGVLSSHPPEANQRIGAHRALTHWKMGWDDPHHPLPEGGARTGRCWPFLSGEGVAWADAGWVYASAAPGKAPRALGTISPEDHLLVGPEGAILVGRDDQWTRCAAPGCALVKLSEPLARGELLVWTPQGLLGAAADGGATTLVNLKTGATTSGEVTIAPTGAWCLHGHLLAGPACRLWDLAADRPLGDPGLVANAATVYVLGSGWATVSHDGVGRWFNDAGEVTGVFRLENGDDVVFEGFVDDGDACFRCASGRGFRVRGETVTRARTLPESPDVDVDDAPEAFAAVGLHYAVTVGAHTWVWGDAGGLARLPAG